MTSSSFRSRQIVTHQNQLHENVLLQLLDTLQRKLLERRGKQTTLVVHGGVLTVLAYKSRLVTTDVDYIERVLPEEVENPSKRSGFILARLVRSIWHAITISVRTGSDARTTIRQCIADTAAEFNSSHSVPLIVLEHDWMNSAADVALPWHLDSDCYMVDPLVNSAVRDAVSQGNAVYDSPGLRLIGITPSWTIATKLQRYSYADEDDIVYLLQRDSACANYSEDDFVRMIEERLRTDCPEMDYEHFPGRALYEWTARLRDCARKAQYKSRTHRGYPDRKSVIDIYM